MVMENTTNIKDLIQKFYPYAKNALGFEHPVRVIMRKDAENAENPLGKTAYYDPEQKLIVLYVVNRHPKDILRSFSHELVHHAQNCRGDLDGFTTAGHYAEDGKGREIEEEAYLHGNLNVRDWEDSIKFKGANQMNEHYQVAKEELKKLVAETMKQVLDEKKAKPDFLDLDGDGDKEESMKKAAKDKKEKVEEKYDDEIAAARALGDEVAKRMKAKKEKVDEMDLEKEKEDAEVMDDMPALEESKQEETTKQVVTETPQQPKEVEETNKSWYDTSLYSKLVSRWTKKGDK
jgi:hypothetical protein